MTDAPRTWNWYNKNYVLWNIAEQLWDRELSIQHIKTKNGQTFHQKSMTATSTVYLKHLLLHKQKKPLDVFTSLSVYDLEPLLGATAEQKTGFFAKTIPKEWIIAFDFDAKKPEHAALDLIKAMGSIRKESPSWKWSIAYSGGKGFHLESDQRVPYSTDDKTGMNGYENNKYLAECMMEIEELETIDTAIYTPRREWRCAYTIHHSGRIKLPLSLDELCDLIAGLPESLEWLKPDQVLKRYKIKDRGMLYQEIDNGNYARLLRLTKKLEEVTA